MPSSPTRASFSSSMGLMLLSCVLIHWMLPKTAYSISIISSSHHRSHWTRWQWRPWTWHWKRVSYHSTSTDKQEPGGGWGYFSPSRSGHTSHASSISSGQTGAPSTWTAVPNPTDVYSNTWWSSSFCSSLNIQIISPLDIWNCMLIRSICVLVVDRSFH